MCRRQHGVIAARQLHALGVSPRAIRWRRERGYLVPVLPTVFALGPVVTEDGRRAAALLAVNGWAALTGLSGAELFGIAERAAGAHAVVTPRWTRTIPGRLVVHHTRAEIPVRRVRGLWVAEPARVLLDAAPALQPSQRRQLVARALDRGLVGETELRRLSLRYPGHHGLAALRAVDVDEARDRRTESPLEDEMVAVLEAVADLPPFVTQHRVTGLSGKRYRGDVAFMRERVLLEADGRTVHERREAMASDRARDLDLAAVGWMTVRVMRIHLRAERDRFVRSLLAVLRSRV